MNNLGLVIFFCWSRHNDDVICCYFGMLLDDVGITLDFSPEIFICFKFRTLLLLQKKAMMILMFFPI